MEPLTKFWQRDPFKPFRTWGGEARQWDFLPAWFFFKKKLNKLPSKVPVAKASPYHSLQLMWLT